LIQFLLQSLILTQTIEAMELLAQGLSTNVSKPSSMQRSGLRFFFSKLLISMQRSGSGFSNLFLFVSNENIQSSSFMIFDKQN
jgi:hypothetical protein